MQENFDILNGTSQFFSVQSCFINLLFKTQQILMQFSILFTNLCYFIKVYSKHSENAGWKIAVRILMQFSQLFRIILPEGLFIKIIFSKIIIYSNNVFRTLAKPYEIRRNNVLQNCISQKGLQKCLQKHVSISYHFYL